jgi:hypothetical protein
MNARQLFTIGFAGAGVIAAFLAWRQQRDVRMLQAELNTLATAKSYWESEATTIAKRNDWLTGHRADLQRDLDALRKAHPSLAAQLTDDSAYFPAIYREPEMQNLLLQTDRARLPLKYERLYREMGLSAGQIAKFEELNVESQGQLLDIHSAADALGLKDTDPTIVALVVENTNQLKQAEVTLLGSSGYAQLKAYDQGEQKRELMNAVATNLLFTSTPLTVDQSAQLAQLMPSVDGSDDLLSRVSSFMSPPQLAALQVSFATYQARALQLKVMKMINAWEAEARPAGEK